MIPLKLASMSLPIIVPTYWLRLISLVSIRACMSKERLLVKIRVHNFVTHDWKTCLSLIQVYNNVRVSNVTGSHKELYNRIFFKKYLKEQEKTQNTKAKKTENKQKRKSYFKESTKSAKCSQKFVWCHETCPVSSLFCNHLTKYGPGLEYLKKIYFLFTSTKYLF